MHEALNVTIKVLLIVMLIEVIIILGTFLKLGYDTYAAMHAWKTILH